MRVTPDCDTIRSFYIYSDGPVQLSPDIALGGDCYLVVWADNRSGVSGAFPVYAARVTPGGLVLDPTSILVSRNTTAAQLDPSVAWGGTRFFVVWGHYNPAPYPVYGRFVNTDGTMASDTIRIATGTARIEHTHVAFSGTNFLAIWVENTTPPVLKGQIISSDGALIGSPFTIASDVYVYKSARICFNGINFLVTYSRKVGDIYQLWGQHYDTNGSPVGTSFRISPSTNTIRYGDVVPGANNRYFNVWSELRGNQYDIYGNLDVTYGIEEKQVQLPKSSGIKSTLITNVIELTNQDGEATIFDVTGRFLGQTKAGVYDCSGLESGVYFVRLKEGKIFKVVKIK